MSGLKFHKVTSLPTASTSLTGNIYFNETDKTINICTGTGWSTYNGNNTWRPLGTGATDAAAGNHTHTGSEVKLTGYSKASSYSAIAASDTVNQAIGKLEGAISGLETLLASI